MSEIGYHRYEGFDLRTKFSWLHSAPGIDAVDSARHMLGSVGNGYLDSDDLVRNVLAGVGVPWQGRAAEAAGVAMQRAAGRAGETGAAGGVGGGAVDGYGQSFEVLRPKIHWEDPGVYGWDDTFWDVTGRQLDSMFGDVFDVQSDYYAAAEENRTLEARADAALYAHEAIARESLAAFPTMEPASALTAGAPPGSGPGAGGLAGGGFGAPSPAGSVGVAAMPTAGTGPTSLVLDAASPGAPLPADASRGGTPSAAGATVPRPPIDLAGALAPGGRATSPMAPGMGSALSGRGPVPTGPGGSGPGLSGTGRRDSGPGFPATGSRGSGLGSPGGHGRPGPQPSMSGTEFGRRFGSQGGGANGSGSGEPLGLARPGGTGGHPPSAGPDHAGSGSRPGGSGPPPEARPQPGRAAGVPNMYGHPPPLGGIGAANGPTEHKTRYWIPSAEAFDVDVPYTPPVIGGDMDGQR